MKQLTDLSPEEARLVHSAMTALLRRVEGDMISTLTGATRDQLNLLASRIHDYLTSAGNSREVGLTRQEVGWICDSLLNATVFVEAPSESISDWERAWRKINSW